MMGWENAAVCCFYLIVLAIVLRQRFSSVPFFKSNIFSGKMNIHVYNDR